MRSLPCFHSHIDSYIVHAHCIWDRKFKTQVALNTVSDCSLSVKTTWYALAGN